MSEPAPTPPTDEAAERTEAPEAYARAERRNAEVRANLVPLRDGERPRAVTVAALLALTLALVDLVLYGAALAGAGRAQPLPAVAGQAILMLGLAWGMWRVRYWAVLGMEIVLGFLIVLVSLLAFVAEDLKTLLLVVAIVGPAGVLFWKLVRAMARIQVTSRP